LDTTSGQIVIGFSSQKNWTLNLFFSSLTLALATLFQAIIFSVTAFRVVVALLNQRRFEQLGQDAVHMVNGKSPIICHKTSLMSAQGWVGLPLV
jgi:hypothetical protein